MDDSILHSLLFVDCLRFFEKFSSVTCAGRAVGHEIFGLEFVVYVGYARNNLNNFPYSVL